MQAVYFTGPVQIELITDLMEIGTPWSYTGFPVEEIKANDNSYKSTPFINKKIVVIHGDINSDTCKRIMELRTDSKGEFEFSAKAGKYGIVIEDWKQVKFVPSVDLNDDVQTMQCLKDEYKKPDLVIQVINKAVSNLSYTVIGYCSGGNPCNPSMGNNRP